VTFEDGNGEFIPCSLPKALIVLMFGCVQYWLLLADVNMNFSVFSLFLFVYREQVC
jgi:hypothetical protein